MNEDNAVLYQQIQAYAFDQANVCLTFSKRLARENNWSAHYTERVIAEYKKFTFLAVAAGHKVTPSEQVDQAWHLHLINSRAYWNEFCPKVLGKPLHHEPSSGGQAEQDKFVDWYQKTLDSYEQLFGYPPPADIWPASAQRFGDDLQVVRVNARLHWIIPKPAFSWPLPKWQHFSLLSLALVCLVISGCAMVSPLLMGGTISLGMFLGVLNFQLQSFLHMNPGIFLITYLKIGIILLLTAKYYKKFRLNRDVAVQSNLSAESLAYLNGGEARVMQTALVALVERGILEIDPDESLKLISNAEPQTLVEFEIVRAINEDNKLKIKTLMNKGTIIRLSARDDLVARGLLVSQEQSNRIQHQIGS